MTNSREEGYSADGNSNSTDTGDEDEDDGNAWDDMATETIAEGAGQMVLSVYASAGSTNINGGKH